VELLSSGVEKAQVLCGASPKGAVRQDKGSASLSQDGMGSTGCGDFAVGGGAGGKVIGAPKLVSMRAAEASCCNLDLCCSRWRMLASRRRWYKSTVITGMCMTHEIVNEQSHPVHWLSNRDTAAVALFVHASWTCRIFIAGDV
jgi:hypothetical protein